MKLFNRVIGVLLVLMLLAGALIWLLSPTISRSALGAVLHEHGLEIDQESEIRLNPFSSKLSVDDLSWRADDGLVFKLDHLSMRYSLWRLMKSEIYVSELVVSGVQGKITQAPGENYALGFSLDGAPDQPMSQSNPDQPKPDQPKQEGAPLDLKVKVDALSLRDIHLSVSIDGQVQNLVVDYFKLQNVVVDGQKVYAQASTALALNPNLFSVEPNPANQRAQPIPDVAFEFANSTNVEVTLADDIGVKFENTHFEINAFQYRDDTYSAAIESLNLELPSGEIDVSDVVNASLDLNVALNELHLNKSGEGTLLDLGVFSLADVGVELQQDVLKANINELGLKQLSLLRAPENASLASISSIVLDTLALQYDLTGAAPVATVNNMLIDGLVADINVSESGQLQGLTLLESESESESDATQASTSSVTDAQNKNVNNSELDADEPAAATPGFIFSLGKIELVSPADIKINDHSIDPAYSKHFTIEQLRLEKVSNRPGAEALNYLLTLKDQDYFSYRIDGSAKPFDKKLQLSLNSVAKEFPVPEVSPYLYKSLGFGVEAGQLDSEANISIVDDMLNGKVKMHLRGAKFASNKAKQADELDMIGQAAVPLNVALDMLKDGKGNIKLTIPVNGDINDPSFGVQHIVGLVVKKAVMSQAQKHLINTFIPYGQVLSVAYSAGAYALKVRFEDLPYLPAQSELQDAQQVYAKQFASLLAKKEKVQVRVCPVVTVAELSEPLMGAQLSDAQKQQLIAIAKARGAAYKHAVINLGIESGRLLLCSPEIDFKEGAQPRIEFSI